MSAEAFGSYNKKEDFKARLIAKSEQTMARILNRLNMAFMFQALDEEEKAVVVGAMGERKAV